MTAEIKITKAEAFEGPAYRFRGEDGYPAAALIAVLVATGANGKLYWCPKSLAQPLAAPMPARLMPWPSTLTILMVVIG